MSKRGSDFLYHWRSHRLPDDAIVDPVLLVIDLAVDAKREAETQGIPGQEIDKKLARYSKPLCRGCARNSPSKNAG